MSIELQVIIGVTVVIATLLIAALAVWFLQKYPLPAQARERDLIDKVTTLSNRVMSLQITVDTLLEDRNRDRKQINLLQNRIQALEVRLAIVTGKSLDEIRNLSVTDALPIVALAKVPPIKPLLLIGGTDKDLINRDRQALRRAKIKFQRLTNATKQDIIAELRRRRQDDTLYWWLVISAHAGPEGILLADGIAGPEFWAEQLVGIELVLLAACASATTADELAGMVNVVIYFTEDIERQAASDFIYAFMRQVADGEIPVNAYRHALDEVPQVSEFVDIRTS